MFSSKALTILVRDIIYGTLRRSLKLRSFDCQHDGRRQRAKDCPSREASRHKVPKHADRIIRVCSLIDSRFQVLTRSRYSQGAIAVHEATRQLVRTELASHIGVSMAIL